MRPRSSPEPERGAAERGALVHTPAARAPARTLAPEHVYAGARTAVAQGGRDYGMSLAGGGSAPAPADRQYATTAIDFSVAPPASSAGAAGWLPKPVFQHSANPGQGLEANTAHASGAGAVGEGINNNLLAQLDDEELFDFLSSG